MAKKSGPAKKKIMKGGGMAKKAGPAKKKVMKKGGMAKKAGPMKGMGTGGKAKSATSVKMNRGAPNVRTVQARGRGAATKGTQFRENT